MIELKSIIHKGLKLLTACEKPQISTWGIYDKTTIEAPVYIGKSQIETAHIGAFAGFNLPEGANLIMSGYRLIIFDLDGTLLDTSKGIFNSVRYAEEKMGLPPTAEENLRKFVGPPPAEIYRELYGLNEEASLQAAMWHREYGRNKAIYEASLYDGVPETLTRLSEQGYILAVATLKRQDIAERVLSFYGIDGYFAHIVGMNMEETDTKAGLIKRICEWEDVISGSEALMIGDSFYDYEGAVEAGVDFVGVSYGFGFDGNEEDIKFAGSFREIKVLAIGDNK